MQPHVDSWSANKLFKISSNLMDKVLKMIKLLECHFPQILLHYFLHFGFKLDMYDKNSLSET
jgi:hypothetical protein